MKVSELIKQLQKAKRKFGDIKVGFDISTVNGGEAEDYLDDGLVHDIDYVGVFKLRYEGKNRPAKTIVLSADNDSVLADETDLLTAAHDDAAREALEKK